MNPRRTLALLCLAFTLPFAVAAADVEAEVRRLDAARVQAILQGDVPALERLFADELVYIHANGRIDSKSGYLSTLKAGNLIYVSLQYDPPAQVRVTGDTAIVTGKANIETKNRSGQLTKRVLTTTTVYARTSQGWKIVSYQGTPMT